MYHSISEDSETSVGPYYRLATNPHRFAEHLAWLGELGFTGVSLEEALNMTPAERRDRQPAAITFDDGFRDFHTAAWPALRQHGFTATMYPPTGFIGSPRKTFRGKECLTWGEIRDLRKAGMRFGSHTVNHPKLYTLPWEAIERETAHSKERLEHELQEEVRSFAYPYAFPQEDAAFAKRFADLLRRQGYDTCVTTVVGRVHKGTDPLRIKRLPANNCDDRLLFRAKLEGAYDWIAGIQRLARTIRRRNWMTPAINID
jgi:peptidoglycan/xylan/chitin deacetylase (PgdA/CDA1 family)